MILLPKKPAGNVKFHCIFYSDFALGEVSTPLLRVSGLHIINGQIDENGMLINPQPAVFDSEIPQLVLLPFIELSSSTVKYA